MFLDEKTFAIMIQSFAKVKLGMNELALPHLIRFLERYKELFEIHTTFD